MNTHLRNTLLATALAASVIGTATSAVAAPPERLFWRTVVGIVQPNNAVGSGAATVLGSALPWTTTGGHVVVDLATGNIEFDVNGLVFAGGNFIGTPGTVEQVKGTLVCNTLTLEAFGAPAVIDTPFVPLDDRGNASFSGSVGPLLGVCSPDSQIAFVIRAGNNRWIANAAVLR